MGASGGAHQSSPDQPQGNPVGMALQVQQLEQQRRMNDAQIALAEAQAEKAGAEATKISGVDTQEALKRIEGIASQCFRFRFDLVKVEEWYWGGDVGLFDALHWRAVYLVDGAFEDIPVGVHDGFGQLAFEHGCG